jgi:hypothetical protein
LEGGTLLASTFVGGGLREVKVVCVFVVVVVVVVVVVTVTVVCLCVPDADMVNVKSKIRST